MYFEFLNMTDQLQAEETIDIRGGVSDSARNLEEQTSCDNCNGGNCNVYDASNNQQTC